MKQNCDTESDATEKRVTNKFYSPPAFNFLQSVMHFFPLWSAVLQSDAERFASDGNMNVNFENDTVYLSNSIIESHFQNIKHGTLQSIMRLRPREFLRKNLTHIMEKLQEAKLPENPRSVWSRVVKKPSVQDIPERWSKRKRTKPMRYFHVSVANRDRPIPCIQRIGRYYSLPIPADQRIGRCRYIVTQVLADTIPCRYLHTKVSADTILCRYLPAECRYIDTQV